MGVRGPRAHRDTCGDKDDRDRALNPALTHTRSGAADRVGRSSIHRGKKTDVVAGRCNSSTNAHRIVRKKRRERHIGRRRNPADRARLGP